MFAPVATSQIFTIVFLPADTTKAPSGLKLQSNMSAPCSKFMCSTAVAAFQIRPFFSFPHDNTHTPSGL
jgi:hypothetical protein